MKGLLLGLFIVLALLWLGVTPEEVYSWSYPILIEPFLPYWQQVYEFVTTLREKYPFVYLFVIPAIIIGILLEREHNASTSNSDKKNDSETKDSGSS